MTASAPPILQVGGYPPPYGGITVHIQRLCREMAGAGLRVRVADPYSDDAPAGKRALWGGLVAPLIGRPWRKALALLKLCRESRVIHFHGSALENLWMLGIAAPLLRAPYVVSIHSGNFPGRWSEMRALKRLCIRSLIARASAVVCVNASLADFVSREIAPLRRSLVLPAFIPPERPATIHAAIASLRERCDAIVLSSGFPLDNYGIDTLIEAVRQLRGTRRIGLALVLYATSDPTNPDRYREEEARVRRAVEAFRAESDAVVVMDGVAPEAFSSIQAGCDVFVRNTRFDGDSVALREAAHLGCRIVASDAVARPPGALLFRAHDVGDLRRAIDEACGREDAGRVVSDVDNAKALISLYRELLATAPRTRSTAV
ncbi:MAG: glycosyltransferase family 4 protein [Kofleriaceae bacterium]|nr:glycosyltransferase family 4 protein [Kofleriaceae bacterium]